MQFTDDGIREIANVAFDSEQHAGRYRRKKAAKHNGTHCEDVSYDVNEGESRTVVIDKKYVENNFRTESRNLKKYVL